MPLRFALRSVVRTARLSLAVILTVALGVAALTTTFGNDHAALFRQPPIPDASRLAKLYLERHPKNEVPNR